MVSAGERLVNLHRQSRHGAARGQYRAAHARAQRSVEDARVPRQHGEVFATSAREPKHLDEVRNVAGTVLDADNVRVVGEARDRLGRNRDAGVLRDVVEDDGHARLVGDGGEVFGQRVLRQRPAVEVRRQREHGVRARVRSAPRLEDREPR